MSRCWGHRGGGRADGHDVAEARDSWRRWRWCDHKCAGYVRRAHMKSQVWSQGPGAGRGRWRGPAETRRDGRSRGRGRGRPGRRGKAKPRATGKRNLNRQGGRGALRRSRPPPPASRVPPTSQSRPDPPDRTVPVAAVRCPADSTRPHVPRCRAAGAGRFVFPRGWDPGLLWRRWGRGREGAGRGRGVLQVQPRSHVLRSQSARTSAWVQAGVVGRGRRGWPCGVRSLLSLKARMHMPAAQGATGN